MRPATAANADCAAPALVLVTRCVQPRCASPDVSVERQGANADVAGAPIALEQPEPPAQRPAQRPQTIGGKYRHYNRENEFSRTFITAAYSIPVPHTTQTTCHVIKPGQTNHRIAKHMHMHVPEISRATGTAVTAVAVAAVAVAAVVALPVPVPPGAADYSLAHYRVRPN